MKSLGEVFGRVVYLKTGSIFIFCLMFVMVVFSTASVCAQTDEPAAATFKSPSVTDSGASRPYLLPGTSDPQFGGSSETIPFSSGMIRNWLPIIPNLQFGFNYLFGRNLTQSWWTADYVLPVNLTSSDIVFGEAHLDSANSASTGGFPFLNNFWQQGQVGLQNRIDLSLGLGYRKLFGNRALLGVYGFYDSTRLSGSWKSAASVGAQIAANGPGESAVDLNVNYYSDSYIGYDSRGSVFPTFNLFGAIAHGEGNYDLEAGLSQPIFNQAYDLRIKLAGYRYDLGNSKVHGLRSGADVTTADGVFKVSAEYGNDRLIGQYGQIGAYINIGFQPENIVKGESPFTKPEPIFKSPRHLRQLASQPAKRNWRKPSAVIANAYCEGLPDDSLFDAGYDKACFYSGYPAAANQCNNAGLTIISQTQGGIQFNQYMAPYYAQQDLNYNSDVKPMDTCASAAYAREAKGDTLRVYITYSKWQTKTGGFFETELPTLLSNPNVQHLDAYVQSVGGTWPTTPTFSYK
ncbi:MAG: hypothetical protein ACP5U1_00045 [Desulfomonilaceae bacterium]